MTIDRMDSKVDVKPPSGGGGAAPSGGANPGQPPQAQPGEPSIEQMKPLVLEILRGEVHKLLKIAGVR